MNSINFKSYADVVEVGDFHPDFTAITGDNGTGKSNLFDGFCFGLGLEKLKAVTFCGIVVIFFLFASRSSFVASGFSFFVWPGKNKLTIVFWQNLLVSIALDVCFFQQKKDVYTKKGPLTKGFFTLHATFSSTEPFLKLEQLSFKFLHKRPAMELCAKKKGS